MVFLAMDLHCVTHVMFLRTWRNNGHWYINTVTESVIRGVHVTRRVHCLTTNAVLLMYILGDPCYIDILFLKLAIGGRAGVVCW